MKKIVFAASLLVTQQMVAQQGDPKLTEVWSPVPKIVTPGKICSAAPSDALVLFGGKNLDQWESVRDTTKAAGWDVADGIMTVNKNAGNIQTRKKFLDYQLHLEYRIPLGITGSGQGRETAACFLLPPVPVMQAMKSRY